MCQNISKGGRRCHAHAKAAFDKATEAFLEDTDSTEKLEELQTARHTLDLTHTVRTQIRNRSEAMMATDPIEGAKLRIKADKLNAEYAALVTAEAEVQALEMESQSKEGIAARQAQVDAARVRLEAIAYNKTKQGIAARLTEIKADAENIVALEPSTKYRDSNPNFYAAKPIPDEELSYGERRKNAVADLRRMGFRSNLSMTREKGLSDFGIDEENDDAIFANKNTMPLHAVGKDWDKNYRLLIASLNKNGVPVTWHGDVYHSVNPIHEGASHNIDTAIEAEIRAVNTTEERRNEFANHESVRVQGLVAFSSKDPVTLTHFANNSSGLIRSHALSNSATPPAVLAARLHKGDDSVLAHNISTPPEALVSILHNSDSNAADAAKQNPSLPAKNAAAVLKEDYVTNIRRSIYARPDFHEVAAIALATDENGNFDADYCESLKSSPPSWVKRMIEQSYPS